MSKKSDRIVSAIEEMKAIAQHQDNPVVHWDRLEPNMLSKGLGAADLPELLEDLHRISAVEKITAEKYRLI